MGYADLLREAMETRGVSRRKLSYAVAEKTGNQQTSEYRALGKYLADGEEPAAPRAAILAVLLQEPALAAVAPNPRVKQPDPLAGTWLGRLLILLQDPDPQPDEELERVLRAYAKASRRLADEADAQAELRASRRRAP